MVTEPAEPAHRYRVVLIRTDDGWQAVVPELPEVRVSGDTLFKTNDFARHAIARALGVPARKRNDLALEFEFRVGDEHSDRLVVDTRQTRAAANAYSARARILTRQAIDAFLGQGLTRRDVAVLVGMSHQRVQQLAESCRTNVGGCHADGADTAPA